MEPTEEERVNTSGQTGSLAVEDSASRDARPSDQGTPWRSVDTDNSNDRLAEIVSAATVLFRNKGYHATTLDDIAHQVGFTKTAIYHYCNSKEDILFAIVEEVAQEALHRIGAIAERDAPVVERLHAILVENARVVLENLDANAVFHSEGSLLSPARASMVRQRVREYTQLVRDLYVTGVANGELLDINPAVATATLLGATTWVYRWFNPQGRLSREQVAEQVAELLMAGYRRT